MSPIQIFTLNARPNYGAAVAGELRAKAERRRAARMKEGPDWRRGVAALERLAAVVEAEKEMDSRVLCALGDIQLAQFTLCKPENRERWRASRWTPTPLQERVLIQLGEAEFPPVEEIFAELIAAGLRDLCEVARRASSTAGRRSQEAREETEALRSQLDSARAEVDRLEGLGAELETAREELAEQRAANEELANLVDALRSTGAAGEEATGQPLEAEPPDLEAVFDAVEARLGRALGDEEIAAVEAAVDGAADDVSAGELADQLAETLQGGAAKATAADSTPGRG